MVVGRIVPLTVTATVKSALVKIEHRIVKPGLKSRVFCGLTVRIMKKNIEYSISSGNLFADVGLPNAEERHAKMMLAIQINALIKKKKITQAAAARLLEIDQPKISALSTGKLSGFSLERLFKFLNILDQ